MRAHPPLRPLTDTSVLAEDGHLWLYEHVTGPILAFSMAPSGLLTFGIDGETRETMSPSLRRAAASVRQRVDRDALREGVNDVEQLVFYG
ncbi:MAG: hypothetical protein ABEJ55_08160, partial [Halanaeroarchaeum sp.]